MPAVVPSIIKPANWSTAVLNHKQGLMADKRVRQAFQAALDMEPIMAAGFGNKAFYRLDPSLMFAEQFGDGLRDLLDPKIRGLATERQRAA